MYAWQKISTNNQKFEAGQIVSLNQDWSMYPYLNMEFGNIFPRKITKVNGDIVEFKVGKDKTISFASQTLTKKSKN
jgi:hypothetical protein